MLASCCNWFCLDATIVEDTNSSTRHQAYTNSGYSSHPSPPLADPTCKACGGRFDTPARKHVCMDCKKTYCARCSAQLDPRPRLCHTCQRFHGTLFERTELMKLKVKDLRDYLHLHEVSTQMCREKEELVELVLGQQTPPPDNAGPQTPAPASTTQQEPAPVPAPVTTASVTTAPVTTAPSTQADPPEPAHQPQAQDDNLSDTEEVLAPGRRASLSDLASAEDIEALSVRQLKEILARNFVNYKGCCEKWELMERVTRLYHDQKDLQNMVSNTIDGTGDPSTTPGMEDSLCKICMDSPIDCVLLECGHMVTCTKCGKRMNECPICRQYVVRAVHVFRS
ncbi:E3 ubiquitin-protein ligase rififylin isoform X2 [Hypomesus transpacificus]|uniref:E3 ubiquitin-protein ligase rififylin isoform X2 n=1 Tax=Hypomesus transpacificus TaxID=137520 RepID=UPI001F0873B5|nr:E3 ubiquitin-protein ligase rififylin isoform X2 [Hypomesus transpacificus]